MPRGRTGLPREHGTERGFNQHQNRKEAACEPCREAHRAVDRDRKAEKRRQYRAANPKPVVDCGTEAGYQQHYRKRTPSCAPCRKAHSEHNRSTYRQKAGSEGRTVKEYKGREVFVRLSLKAFASLYWTASTDGLALLDEALGADQVDQLIKKAEEL